MSYSNKKSFGLDTNIKNYTIYQHLSILSSVILTLIVFILPLGEVGNWYLRLTIFKLILPIDILMTVMIVSMGLIADFKLKSLFILLSVPVISGLVEYFFLMLLKTSFPIKLYTDNYLTLLGLYLIYGVIVLLNYSKVEYTKVSHSEYEELMKL